MANLVYSSYQKDIFDFVKNGKGNAVISAVAGSGKTTTIVEATKYVPKTLNVLFLAFNKSIATELSERLKNHVNVECKTMHAHGLASLRYVSRFIRVLSYSRFQKEVRDRSVTFSKILTVDSPNNLIWSYNKNVIKLLDLCRINLIQSGDLEGIRNISVNHNFELVADEVDFVSELLTKAYEFPKDKFIDFTDMITLPVTLNKVKKYDFIFIDECQDLSKAQRELMLKSLAPNGRFVAVGDRKQAINGFAGASCDSFDLLANIDNTKELPLSVNYRCGKRIIGLVKDIVPQIEASKNAILGEINERNSFDGLRNGDMILCRLTAPLIALCLRLWKLGYVSYVKGSEVGEALMNLINRLNPKTVVDLMDKIEMERKIIIKDLRAKGVKEPTNNYRYRSFDEKVECLNAIIDGKRTNDINVLLETLKDIFSDDTPNVDRICLSTVHKAKGLEADNVWIILPELLPFRREGQKDWEMEQEKNLQYVAYTRAKKVLNFVNLSNNDLAKI